MLLLLFLFVVCNYHLYSNIWSLFPNPNWGGAPLFLEGGFDPTTRSRVNPGQPLKLKVVHHPGLALKVLRCEGRALMPRGSSPLWSQPNLLLVFFAHVRPGSRKVPNNQKRRVIQENCHLLLLDFFLVTPKGAKKDRDGCWTNTSHLASLEHVMCYGLKMFKDMFKLFQVVSDCNNTKFNISYVSFLSKYLSH